MHRVDHAGANRNFTQRGFQFQQHMPHQPGRNGIAGGRSQRSRAVISGSGLFQKFPDTFLRVEIRRQNIQRVDFLQQFRRAVLTLFRLFRQHFHDQARGLRRDGIHQRAGIGNRIGNQFCQNIICAFPGIRNFSGKHFIQCCA